MEALKTEKFTIEQYFQMDDRSEVKHEYCDGEIFAMTGASIHHNRMVGNLYFHLRNGLAGKPCDVFMSDLRVWVPQYKLFAYPDLCVICEVPQFYKERNDTITNPSVIVEVLSPSTKNYDRGQKFVFYRSLPGLNTYILVDHETQLVEHYGKNTGGKWELTEYTQGSVALESMNLVIPMDHIYEGVPFN